MYILGISAYYHDSAACLIKDGVIVAASQEERFTRKKHDDSFPKKAVEYCLKEAGITIDQVDYVSFYEKPFLKFERLLETYLTFAPKGILSFIKSMPIWLRKKLWMKEEIIKELGSRREIIFIEHHLSHAASAFFPSPYPNASFLTIDGVGELATTTYGVGRDGKIDIIAELDFPHSLGMLYSAFTYYTGFKVNSGEYKVMGLAPYGRPIYKDIILDKLIDLKDDGSFHLNMEYFDYPTGLTMTNSKFNKLFNGPPRKPESPLTQKEMDLARSVQEVTDMIVLKIAAHIKKTTGDKNLVLAGGVALNCVSNGKLLEAKIFDNIWIQPAAGDAGGALGSAIFVWYQYLGNNRLTDGRRDLMQGSYLGPSYSDEYIEEYLKKSKIPFVKLDQSTLCEKVSDLISKEKIIGWFQGRMEYGPRALGNRSILGDSRSAKMQSEMNLKIKFRESFRPFAPSILIEKVSDFFNIDRESPYMLIVANIKDDLKKPVSEEDGRLFGIERLNIVRSSIPGVTHVDYSARIQTVSNETNPLYHKLISEFDKKTGFPIVINTSFNVRGEPVVCTPQDAYLCFMRTDIDYLVMGSYLISKSDQEKMVSDSDWRTEFALD